MGGCIAGSFTCTMLDLLSVTGLLELTRMRYIRTNRGDLIVRLVLFFPSEDASLHPFRLGMFGLVVRHDMRIWTPTSRVRWVCATYMLNWGTALRRESISQELSIRHVFLCIRRVHLSYSFFSNLAMNGYSQRKGISSKF